MATHNLLSKVDRALVAYVIAGGAGTPQNTFPAKRAAIRKDLSCIICYSHSGRPAEDLYTGNYMVEASVEVRSSALIKEGMTEETPRDLDDALVAAVFDLFHFGSRNSGAALAKAITQAANINDFAIDNVRVTDITQGFNPRSLSVTEGQMGNAWINAIHLEILCRPSR